MTRERLFDIIEKDDDGDKLSLAYDLFMIAMILISLIPLAFKGENAVFETMDKMAVIVFIIDYLLRWYTADYKFEKHRWTSFARYPLSTWAIIDLLSILPSLSFISNSFRALRVLRMFRALRVVRVFKALRYSKSFAIIGDVLQQSKRSLIAVGCLAVGYILISALVVFNVEPDSFGNFFDAVYWATVSLTTVGYGDIYPVTTIGRMITMVSAMFGIAVVALPAGIITAGYVNEVRRQDEEQNAEKQKQLTDNHPQPK